MSLLLQAFKLAIRDDKDNRHELLNSFYTMQSKINEYLGTQHNLVGLNQELMNQNTDMAHGSVILMPYNASMQFIDRFDSAAVYAKYNHNVVPSNYRAPYAYPKSVPRGVQVAGSTGVTATKSGNMRVVHVVKRGQTLSAIARVQGIS